MRIRSSALVSAIVVLVAALVAAPWPDGDLTGEDRGLVARPRRVGTVRLDADAGHSPDDANDPSLTVVPVDRAVSPATATAPVSLAAVLVSVPGVAPPLAARLDRATAGQAPSRSPHGRRSRARAPPLA